MDWIDLISRAEFLRRLFPTAPSLTGIRVHEVSLHQDGPRVVIRFDLNDFPKQPPAKWAAFNKVQVKLTGIGVNDWEMRGFTTDNISDISIESAGGAEFTVTAKGEDFFLRGSFDFLFLDSASAYRNERNPAVP